VEDGDAAEAGAAAEAGIVQKLKVHKLGLA
jgi:hypothetical protein